MHNTIKPFALACGALILAASSLSATFTQAIRLDDNLGLIRPGSASFEGGFHYYAVVGPTFEQAAILRDLEPLEFFNALTGYASGEAVPAGWQPFRVLLEGQFTFSEVVRPDPQPLDRFVAEQFVSHPVSDAGRLVWGLATSVPLAELSPNDHLALWANTGMTLTTNPTAIVRPIRTITANVGPERIVWGSAGSVGLAPIPEPSTYAALFGIFALAGVMIRRRLRK
jgi:hypothetical protein